MLSEYLLLLFRNLPRIEQNDEGGVIIGGGSLWLTDTGNEANEDEAWKFIEYITTPDVQA